MTNPTKIILLLALIFALTNCKSRKPDTDESQLFYIQNHGVLFNCSDSLYIDTIEISTNAAYEVILYRILGVPNEIKLYYQDSLVLFTDSIRFNKKNPIKLIVEIDPTQKSIKDYTVFRFETDHPKDSIGYIRYWYNTYLITPAQLVSGDTIRIDRKANCLDSIRFYFPSMGTITSVHLINPTSERNIYYGNSDPTISFDWSGTKINPFDKDNFVHLNRRMVGVYYVVVNSCHWSNQHPKRPLIIDYR